RLSVSLFYHATATTEIYTLSLHDALPICSERGDVCLDRNVSIERSLSERMIADARQAGLAGVGLVAAEPFGQHVTDLEMLGLFRDRKSTRLNSSHLVISYAVFCLKKEKIK